MIAATVPKYDGLCSAATTFKSLKQIAIGCILTNHCVFYLSDILVLGRDT